MLNLSSTIEQFNYYTVSIIHKEINSPNEKIHNFSDQVFNESVIDCLTKGSNSIPCTSRFFDTMKVQSKVLNTLKNLIRRDISETKLYVSTCNYDCVQLCSLPNISNSCLQYEHL